MEILPKKLVIAFAAIALGWGIFGSALSMKFSSHPQSALAWMLVLWMLCVLDLIALAKTVAAATILMSDQFPEKKAAFMVQTLVWGTTKFAVLGFLGIVLWKAQAAPKIAVVLGVATLLVVPLIGGFWWSQVELKLDPGLDKGLSHA